MAHRTMRAWPWWLGAMLASVGLILALGVRTGSCSSGGDCTSSLPGGSVIVAAILILVIIACVRRALRARRTHDR